MNNEIIDRVVGMLKKKYSDTELLNNKRREVPENVKVDGSPYECVGVDAKGNHFYRYQRTRNGTLVILYLVSREYKSKQYENLPCSDLKLFELNSLHYIYSHILDGKVIAERLNSITNDLERKAFMYEFLRHRERKDFCVFMSDPDRGRLSVIVSPFHTNITSDAIVYVMMLLRDSVLSNCASDGTLRDIESHCDGVLRGLQKSSKVNLDLFTV